MTTRMLSAALGLVPMLLAGCSTSGTALDGMEPDAAVQTAGTQKDHVDYVFTLRQQATAFREMAERREVEADLLSVNGDASSEDTAKRKHALAQRLRTAADSLDDRAREAWRQVPHGMLQ